MIVVSSRTKRVLDNHEEASLFYNPYPAYPVF